MVQALLVERSIYLPCRAAYLIRTRSAHPVILPVTIDSVLPGYHRAKPGSPFPDCRAFYVLSTGPDHIPLPDRIFI